MRSTLLCHLQSQAVAGSIIALAVFICARDFLLEKQLNSKEANAKSTEISDSHIYKEIFMIVDFQRVRVFLVALGREFQ